MARSIFYQWRPIQAGKQSFERYFAIKDKFIYSSDKTKEMGFEPRTYVCQVGCILFVGYCCATAEARSMNNNETIKKSNANNKKMTQEV